MCKFKTELLRDGDYECHGCAGEENLTAITLPNLCNQPLVLCDDCKKKLKETL